MELNNINDVKNQIEKACSNMEDLDKLVVKQLDEIIKLMPIEINKLIEEAFKFKRIPKEYLLSSIFFCYGNASGLAFSIKSLGYINFANLYFAIVGNRGDSKSPAMDIATAPLNEYDKRNYEKYNQNIKNENDCENVRKQLFLQDATIESAQLVHFKNKYSIGIFIDELMFLIKKMANKNSNDGSAWRTFLLQGNTNKFIDISRKTVESFRIEKSCPSLMGSIQDQFIPELFADGNLESGLIDRILFTTKITFNPKLTEETISIKAIENYSKSLMNLMNYRAEIELNTEIDTIELQLDIAAKKRMMDYSQELIIKQNKQTDFTREYIAKMLINIHKLTLLVHLIQNASNNNFNKVISINTLELAILINDFYLTNFKIILRENISKKDELPTNDGIIRYAIKNGASQKDVVAITGMNKGTVSRHWNNIINSMQPAT
jgi:hypothetical protein